MLILFAIDCYSQEINLLQEFNGRYDFTIIGNTLNLGNNLGNGNSPCVINTETNADLFLGANDYIEKAFLYWAGSGPGDLEISLNNVPIVADRFYNTTQTTTLGTFVLFDAFADVTELVKDMGNGNYNVSEFDLTEIIPAYCPNAINFGGWAMVIVYSNPELKLTQLNIYDGLKSIGNGVPITIELDGLNVVDKVGSKIGFIAWEGDANINVGEVLKLNGVDLFNPPLNPLNNAFNGTNSITESSDLYNMDIDVYDIEDYIDNGDSTAFIEMNSSQDFVMISTIITKLNSQVPDATVTIENYSAQCNSRQIEVNYTVHNLNSTNFLRSGVPISIFADNEFIEYDEVVYPIPIGGFEEKYIILNIPDHIPDQFTLTIIVDQDPFGNGIVTESNENNNTASIEILLPKNSSIKTFDTIYSCLSENNNGKYDFSAYQNIELDDLEKLIGFYQSEDDANDGVNPIYNINNYETSENPITIYVRIENEYCYSISSFELKIKKCPPIIYNLITANNDGANDYFIIEGLYHIFLNFELEIYNKWGQLVWKGNHQNSPFRGDANVGNSISGTQLPVGTYYYILNLNDPEFSQPYNGFIHLTR